MAAQPSELVARDYAALEATYSDLQRQFEQGALTEFQLLDSFKVFYLRDAAVEPQLDEWVDLMKTPTAYLARGIYYRKRGEFRRGTGYTVPQADMEFMKVMLVLAKRDLQTALRLKPKSYLTVLNLINVAQFEQNEAAASELLALGNALVPGNIMVRARYLIHLTPKWGGSYEKMERFIGASREEGVSQELIDMLRAIELDDRGAAAEEKRDAEAARSAYVGALSVSRAASARFRAEYLRASLRVCAIPAYHDAPYCQ